jgi:prolyl oligopeptidase
MNDPSETAHDPAHGELAGFLATQWERTLAESPNLATELGDRRHNRRWPEVGLNEMERRNRDNQQALATLRRIHIERLPADQRLNCELYRQHLENLIEEHQHRWFLLPLTAREGIQDASTLADAILFEDVTDYEDWIARLRAFPRYMDQTIDLMRHGMREGMLHPRVVMERVPGQIQRQLAKTPDASPFFKPFTRFPGGIPQHQQEQLRGEARRAIASDVIPAFERMLVFFAEYLSACPTTIGIWQLPHGAELYRFFARKFTTVNHSPEAIHQIGLDEVERLRAHMEEIVGHVGFPGSWGEFLEHLRTAPQFHFASADDLQAAYRGFCEGVDRTVGRLFHRLPRVGYDIRPIPMNIAPDTTTAYYRPPSANSRRPGTYFINLYRPEIRPRYEIPVLSLHEAVPGHHLQIGRAMELDDLPAFRRYAPEGTFTGYVEGWALYAESLGEAMGCYEDPYARFGQLTYAVWRAARLVVDTGIHAFQWDRQRAIEYFLDNTAKVRHDIENEVDRYIAWPGQALAYKIGELEISRLRRLVEDRLGSQFDVRDFHEVILTSGPVPLDLLETRVRHWLDHRRN